MQVTTASLVKLAFVLVSIGAVVGTPTSLEARQLSCLADFCIPGANSDNQCCENATCAGVNAEVLDIPLPGVSQRDADKAVFCAWLTISLLVDLCSRYVRCRMQRCHRLLR